MGGCLYHLYHRKRAGLLSHRPLGHLCGFRHTDSDPSVRYGTRCRPVSLPFAVPPPRLDYELSHPSAKDRLSASIRWNEGAMTSMRPHLMLPHSGHSESSDERRSLLRYYRVFNVEQTEGLEKHLPPPPEEQPFTPIETAARIIEAMPQRPPIRHDAPEARLAPRREISSTCRARRRSTLKGGAELARASCARSNRSSERDCES